MKLKMIYRSASSPPHSTATAVLCRLIPHTHLRSKTQVLALRKMLYLHLGEVTEIWAKILLIEATCTDLS